ncbi:thiaminase [Rossellomorea marisflavi]
MGKKLVKFLFIFTLVVSGFFGVVGSKAEAASSNGGYIKTNGGKCTVRMYSDYYTYSKTASTVDAWATASGTCKTMYYTMRIKYGDSGHNAGTQIHTGSFSSQTPTKAFSISRIGKSEPSNTYRVWIDLYSNSSKTNWIGATDTKVIINR